MTEAELYFYEYFKDKPIESWMYSTCFFLEVKREPAGKVIEETVELNRIIGGTHEHIDPTYRTKTKNWLDWFQGMDKKESFRNRPFETLNQNIEKHNYFDSTSFSLYQVLNENQFCYFIREGHHRITFLKIRGDKFFHFKSVIPLVLTPEVAIIR